MAVNLTTSCSFNAQHNVQSCDLSAFWALFLGFQIGLTLKRNNLNIFWCCFQKQETGSEFKNLSCNLHKFLAEWPCLIRGISLFTKWMCSLSAGSRLWACWWSFWGNSGVVREASWEKVNLANGHFNP
jgi:hypothetical protein